MIEDLLNIKKILQAIKIEVLSIRDLTKYGMPSHIIQFFGGIGDDLLCTTVTHEIKKRVPDSKIWILTSYPELFIGNPDITKVLSREDYWYIWYSPMLRSKRLQLAYTSERYPGGNLQEDISPNKHILQIMCDCAAIPSDIDLRPYFFLSDEEKKRGKLYDIQIAIQCIGPDSGTAMYNKLWYVDRFQKVVTNILSTYPNCNIIQIGSNKEPLLNGVHDYRGKTTIRETASILNNSKCFIGTVGFLMHLARAVECRSVIIYGGREHSWQTGYRCNQNIESNIGCAPCWKWNDCYDNKECMDLIDTSIVISSLKKIIIF